MSRSYDDWCAEQEGPEPDTMECPCADGCDACGGSGELDLRASRAKARAEAFNRDAAFELAWLERVALPLVGLSVPCWVCRSSGQHQDRACPRCGGSGSVSAEDASEEDAIHARWASE